MPHGGLLLSLLRASLAETFGVFLLVAVGGLAIIGTGDMAPIGAPLAFGAVIGLLVYTLGRTSGAHLNPAITLALTATGRHPLRHVPAYLTAQLMGGTAGAVVVAAVTRNKDALLTAPLPALQTWQAVLIEALATAVLAFVIMYAADRRSPRGDVPAAPIGFAVGLGALFAGPFTGGSMNPARSIGPALAAGAPGGLWIYLAGPLLGALAGAFLHDLVTGRMRSTRKDSPIGSPRAMPRLEDTP